MFRKIAGYIVIVMRVDYEYECTLNNQLFTTSQDALNAIGASKQHDERDGNVREYHITTVYSEA